MKANLKKCIAVLAMLCALTTLAGCEEDDKDKAADVLDAGIDAAQDALENAPSGDEIIDAASSALDAMQGFFEEKVEGSN